MHLDNKRINLAGLLSRENQRGSAAVGAGELMRSGFGAVKSYELLAENVVQPHQGIFVVPRVETAAPVPVWYQTRVCMVPGAFAYPGVGSRALSQDGNVHRYYTHDKVSSSHMYARYK